MDDIDSRKVVYTLGYGGRELDEFIGLIKSLGITMIIDVRRWNRSMRNPAFTGDSLKRHLEKIGVRYTWLPELGGYRRFGVDVDDHGVAYCFESPGFRAYANYIIYNSAVKHYLNELVSHASREIVALLCAERYPWRCHRKILADYLVARGFRVLHVIDEKQIIEHKLSKCAMIVDGDLRYI